MAWALDIPVYDTVESLDELLSIKKEDPFYEAYRQLVDRIKSWAKVIKDETSRKEYIRKSLNVLATLEEKQVINKSLNNEIILSSREKIEDLALKMQLNFATQDWYEIRNSCVNSLWLDKDPKNNGIPGQIALAVLDFVFSTEDMIYMIYEAWKTEWYSTIVLSIIKAIFSPEVWWELLKAIGQGGWDLITDWEPWATYKKVLAGLALWWWYGIIKSALKWVLKVWAKGIKTVWKKGVIVWAMWTLSTKTNN